MTNPTSPQSTILSAGISFTGMLSAAGFAACTATVLGFLGQAWWFFDLFSHFRVQYLLGLSVIALILLLFRKRRISLVFAAFALINLAVILPIYIGKPPAGTLNSPALRAMLINVNTQNGSAERVAECIRENNPDLLVLEEINTRWLDNLQSALSSYPYSNVHPRDDNFGIALFSKLPFSQDDIIYFSYEAYVPSIFAGIRTGSNTLHILATHPVPPGGAEYSMWRNDHLDSLAAFCRDARQPLILLGDLNVTPWNTHFRKLLKTSGLLNSSQGWGIQPTWPADNPLLLIPLDHFLHSPDITIVRKSVGKNAGSDHYPVIVDFAINEQFYEDR
jgi:endonuclease/exonuclease/phosphatase (EEP) superfamily protein YafD